MPAIAWSLSNWNGPRFRFRLIDRNLLRSMTFILFEIGKDIYAEDFEKPFKEEMQLFYAYESQAFLEANSCPDYLKKVEARLREEYDRVHSCLPSDYAGGEGSIKQVAEHELIGKHKETLVDKDGSGLTRLLEDDKVDDLKRMYDLFSRVRGGGELLEDRVALFCLEKGKEIVLSTDNQADPLLYVRKLLELKERMDHFVKEAFKGERAFTNKTHRSFSEILNLYARSPEYISLAMDNYLRGGKGSSSAGSRGGSASSSKVGGTLGEVVTEEQVEAVLEKCLQLFRFLSEKDMFERYYKQHLAKRLLYDRSQSEEMERKVIQMLKTECGYQFTAKLEGMFKDVGTSKDVQERFGQLQQLHERRESGQIVDLQIKVLTTGYWPTTASSQVYRLPAEVEAVRGSFERFYLNQHNGRKLTWQLAQGSADVKAKYDKVYQINMPTQHMVVLMLFNEGGAGAAGGGEGATLTLAEIEKATGLSQSELKRVMQSLALSNFKLLSKEPKTKEVEATDKFTVNKGFTNRMIKFKMSVVAATKETNEEHQASRAKIQEDRGPQIDAAIVRVMKSRKTMNHNDLMVEVTKQLQSRFTPHPGDIKKRIEGLIGREFLTRSTSAMNVYEYVA
mmetsp:Transcript_70308/g.187332  ORF Transcript_70308/g.187332 Transcript_70308/m.187332 type:complete len:620 (+) Transcript_70308:94-1953(+)